jgi:hypothetical protein
MEQIAIDDAINIVQLYSVFLIAYILVSDSSTVSLCPDWNIYPSMLNTDEPVGAIATVLTRLCE